LTLGELLAPVYARTEATAPAATADGAGTSGPVLVALS
jgi:hypothetical protein